MLRWIIIHQLVQTGIIAYKRTFYLSIIQVLKKYASQIILFIVYLTQKSILNTIIIFVQVIWDELLIYRGSIFFILVLVCNNSLPFIQTVMYVDHAMANWNSKSKEKCSPFVYNHTLCMAILHNGIQIHNNFMWTNNILQNIPHS